MKRKILKQLDLPEYKQPLNSVVEFLDNLSYSAVKTKYPAFNPTVCVYIYIYTHTLTKWCNS